ncbi:hypothetical protein G5V58_07415 [Nocardioides anomalus]|uniref:Uncharacterized protein n=1 Tax=Nocardioides anomalus TaxID=2712223 RepID=A0A6G6WC64_9ACTN|nr:hypothetical protein [Nocardioides anomalus]QIG42630.1 hypothetical protein G5V58_07415 [Nocardioides anomalus]
MLSGRTVWRWAVASHEQALANARGAATACARARVERAEVEQFLLARAQGVEVSAAQPPVGEALGSR